MFIFDDECDGLYDLEKDEMYEGELEFFDERRKRHDFGDIIDMDDEEDEYSDRDDDIDDDFEVDFDDEFDDDFEVDIDDDPDYDPDFDPDCGFDDDSFD